jgi:peptide deformylase
VVHEVLVYPHPALKQVARTLDPGEEEEIARVAADLVDTMDSRTAGSYSSTRGSSRRPAVKWHARAA